MKRIALLLVASLMFASVTFAVPVLNDQSTTESVSAKAEKASPMVTVTVLTDRSVSQPVTIEQLAGRSTYALSRCAPTFTPITNTIARRKPLLQPPVQSHY